MQLKHTKNKGWDNVANWYTGWVGEKGSKHHINNALPVVLNLLDLKNKSSIIDFGCGTGMFARHSLKENTKLEYVGVEISPKLLKYAKSKFFEYGKFVNFDLTKKGLKQKLNNKLFDAGLFLLSIQDISDLDKAVQNASSVIKDHGNLIFFMLHPSFRVPRQSGWGHDDKRKLMYRRIDSYLSANSVPYKTDEKKKKILTYFYHRPLQEYFRVLKENEFVTTDILEIPSYKVNERNNIDKVSRRAFKEIPLFLVIKAKKIKNK